MRQVELSGDPPVAIALKRSARAKRISLRVSDLDGKVTLTLPKGVAEAEALAFAQEKADWIRKALRRRGAAHAVRFGGTLPFAGRELPVVAAGRGAARITETEVQVPDAPERFEQRLKAALKEAARARIVQGADAYAAALGRPYGRITLRDTRSRWGSCSSRGDLMFSWRLIMGPPEVLDYVVAHEVAHLQEMNHSAAFWAVVARLYPGYEAPRMWLRQHGASLHRVQFGH